MDRIKLLTVLLTRALRSQRVIYAEFLINTPRIGATPDYRRKYANKLELEENIETLLMQLLREESSAL